MKKFLAVLLAAVMMLGVSGVALADTKTVDALDQTSATSIQVVVSKIEKGLAEVVYSVDIEWDNLSFTCNVDKSSLTWNPESHTYEDSNNDAVSWTITQGNITVTNHSNADVEVLCAFVDASEAYVGSTEINSVEFEIAGYQQDVWEMLAAGEENKPDDASNCVYTVQLTDETAVPNTTFTGRATVNILIKAAE